MDFTECYSDTVSGPAAAARSGCSRRLRSLIRRGGGGGLRSRDNRGWTALHEAAAAGSGDCVREILSAAGAGSSRSSHDFVNSLTHEGESACYLAAQRGHLQVVRLLLKARSDINQLTNDLSCPLYAAVDNGHTDVVQLLVRRGADVDRTHTASCWSCLHQAAHKGHSDIVRLLVGVCNLEVEDDHRISPLFVASQYGRTECLQILAEAGADVNTRSADLATPLLIASQKGHQACVDLLLQHGADPNAACSQEWPQLPVHAAAEFGHVSILRRLIAVTDRVCERGEGAVSPLYVAVHGDRPASVSLLLQEGYSPDAQDCSELLGVRSPLALALQRSAVGPYSECVRLLVAAGAVLSEDDWMYAFSTHSSDLLRLVLEHRRIPGLCGAPSRPPLQLQELRGMLCVALGQLRFAASWLHLLLTAGLEPAVLLHTHMLQHADSQVLNYLLEFVNWSLLPAHLKLVLARRRSENTWEPCAHFDSVPRLSHLCRLQVRDVLGPDRLMRTDVVRQLPVPAPLHGFLTFKDVPEASWTRSPPPSPLLERIERCQSTHLHRHVL